MFDFGMDELLVIAVVAVVVIPSKDLPMALRTFGRWTAKLRRMSGHFRAGIDTMIREAELEEMERKWKEQNAAIMAAHPLPESEVVHDAEPPVAQASAEAALPPPASKGEMLARGGASKEPADLAEPTLPFPPGS